MPCIESDRRRDGARGASRARLWPCAAVLLAACQAPAPPAEGPRTPSSPQTPPAGTAAPTAERPVPVQSQPATPGATPRPPPAAERRTPVALPAPRAARTWDEFRLQAARRLVDAHPEHSYTTPSPDPLLAIPVLSVELNADGSVRRVGVMRSPRQAKDTEKLAIDAVHRAAPYGAMHALKRPWTWTVTFLFDDDRRFKPRDLD